MSITHLPNETLEQIFYQLPSSDAANLCKATSWLRDFCTDRRIRLTTLVSTYTSWSAERRLSRLKELLISVTEYRDLEQIQALLVSDDKLVNMPIVVHYRSFYQATFYPLDYAFHPLTVYVLLSFGARADLSSKFSEAVRRIYYHFSYSKPVKGKIEDVEKDLVRSLDSPRYTLTQFYARLHDAVYFRLLFNYKQVQAVSELADICTDVESAINVLRAKLDPHPIFPIFHHSSTFVRRRIVSLINLNEELESAIGTADYDATLYLVRFGADITQMEVTIMVALAAKVDKALSIAELFTLVTKTREALTTRKLVDARSFFLQQDLALIANCQDLVPEIWSDESFWEEKFQRDFADEPLTTFKGENDTWRRRYHRQITTPCFVVESNQRQHVLCLNFSEGRGFLSAYYAGGFRDLVKFVAFRRECNNLYSLNDQYGIDEVYAKTPDLLNFTVNSELPTKRYYATFGTAKVGQSVTLQFSSLSYVHGYLQLCQIAGVTPLLSEPRELVG